MITIEDIAANLQDLAGEFNNLGDDIRATFEDYSFEGESKIIVNKINPCGLQILAYADHRSSPQLKISIIEDNNEYLIEDVKIIY